MHLLRVWMAILAITMLVLSITLAQNNCDVSACVRQDSEISSASENVKFGEITPGQWKSTDPLTINVNENSPNDLLVEDQTDHDGHLYNEQADHLMEKGLEVGTLLVNSSPKTLEQLIDPGTSVNKFDLHQEVTWNDPVGFYWGQITLTLSPSDPRDPCEVY